MSMRRKRMPWKETGPLQERMKFVAACLRDDGDSFTAICEQFGISRQKGYKWLDRYDEGGIDALADRSRRPHSNSRVVAPAIVELIVELRRRRPRWGPRKLLAVLERDYPRLEFPVASTIGSILHARGLVSKRRRRAPSVGYGEMLSEFVGPNSVWCADFKGQFLVGKRYCHPLTVTDGFSRFLLRCTALKQTLHAPVQKVFEDAFLEFGLPDTIRTDNGPPFASVTVGGLSRLAVWWIQLGIKPERILPGHPEQNGRHERMHRTLKAETARPPATTFAGQVRAFDAFRHDYNFERPHEAIGQRTPATLYSPSTRSYTSELRDPEYPRHFESRRAYPNGVISVGQTQWYLSGCLANQLVGLEPIADGCWRVLFGPVALGLLDTRGTVQRNMRNFGLLTRLPNDARRRARMNRRRPSPTL
jgi:transposase InsO family protein